MSRILLLTVAFVVIGSGATTLAQQAESIPWGDFTYPGTDSATSVQTDALRRNEADRSIRGRRPAGSVSQDRYVNARDPQPERRSPSRTPRIAMPEMAPGTLPVSRSKPQPLESAQVLAIVGNEPILAGDLLGRINKILEPYVNKATEAQLEQQRQALVQQVLPQAIEVKLAYLDFLREVPPDKKSEVLAHAYKVYDQQQLPKVVEAEGAKNVMEFDAILRRRGSSLDDERRMFAEMVLAGEATRRNAEFNKVVSHDELLQVYRANREKYELPAKARWEHLMARFTEFPSAADAEKAIKQMGNEVLQGAALEAVAKRSSSGATAADGGQYNWTTKGSLASEKLDRAIFSLPIAHLSRVIKDERGFHIIRVIERVPAGRTPFSEVQNEIREQIVKQRAEKARSDYGERLRNEIYVWTAFDDSRVSVANRP